MSAPPIARMDLTVPDVVAAAAFLRQLFGWEVGLVRPDGQHVLVHDDEVVASVVPQPVEAAAAGIPPAWMLSVGVPALEPALLGITGTGGRLAVPPFAVPGASMAITVDRLGAVVALVEEEPTALRFRPPAWAERTTADADAVLVTVNAAFDWSARPVPGASVHTWCSDGVGAPVAALVHGAPAAGRLPERWVPFVGVADVGRMRARAGEIGGSVLRGGAWRGELVVDPWGAVLGLVPRS